MPKFRLVDGTHTEPGEGGEPLLFKKGDIVESDLPLDELFINKFQRVKSSAPVTDAPTLADVAASEQNQARKEAAEKKRQEKDKYALDVEDEEESVEEDEDEEKAPVKSKLGEDVTSEFPVAEEEGLLVFKKGKAYFVTEKEDPNSPVSEEPLTKKAVKKWIDEYVG